MSYIYRHVLIDRIVDGDTVALEIDLGNKVAEMRERCAKVR